MSDWSSSEDDNVPLGKLGIVTRKKKALNFDSSDSDNVPLSKLTKYSASSSMFEEDSFDDSDNDPDWVEPKSKKTTKTSLRSIKKERNTEEFIAELLGNLINKVTNQDKENKNNGKLIIGQKRKIGYVNKMEKQQAQNKKDLDLRKNNFVTKTQRPEKKVDKKDRQEIASLLSDMVNKVCIEEDIKRMCHPGYIVGHIIDGVVDIAVMLGENEKQNKKKKRGSLKEIRKAKYNLGQEYEKRTGGTVAARVVKAGCNDKTCKRKCKSKINEEKREQLMKSFWKLGDNQLRWSYISNTVISLEPKFRKSGAIRQNKATLKYILKTLKKYLSAKDFTLTH